MKTLVDARLRAEASQFAFRFACEDCAQFCAARGCAHGYPLAPRRADLDGDEIVFCKEFETA
ncbi:MAG: hypothetical protein ABI551_18845 [Polyangiaceae bacterium]